MLMSNMTFFIVKNRYKSLSEESNAISHVLGGKVPDADGVTM